MATKPKATWNKIEISGYREAYVAVVQGKEIGTIARCSRNSAWNVVAGIGERCQHIGNCYAKEGAKYMLLTAPEKFWR